MTRCPNCYNSITPDAQNCPSCAFLLIERQKTTGPLAPAVVATQAETSGTVQTVPEVVPSGKLDQPEQLAQFGASHPSYSSPSGRLQKPAESGGTGEERPRTAYRTASGNGSARGKSMAQRKGRQFSRELEEREARRRKKKILIPIMVVGLAVAVVLLAPATQLIAPQVDAQTSISTLSMLRSEPSKRAGESVDQYINDWVEQSRKTGDLISLSGWFVKPIRFDKSKILLGFTLEEKGGVKTAEWVADVHNNVFTPKNDLAAQVYGDK